MIQKEWLKRALDENGDIILENRKKKMRDERDILKDVLNKAIWTIEDLGKLIYRAKNMKQLDKVDTGMDNIMKKLRKHLS